MAGVECGWGGGGQGVAGSVEFDRERSLVGEVAGVGDEFAGRLWEPSVCHIGTQPGWKEVVAHFVL